ncbi:MAG: hypothetical protein JW832_13665 [Deltaproteobacteria bacterium]|nr:hypothetical protein [Deltaproteobacteria bacterium]
MKAALSFLSAYALLSVLLHGTAAAHVPYIEKRDYSFEQPFRVRGSVENSIAVYGWLESGNDTDVYRLEIPRPARLYCNALVPVCPAYGQFLPWLAIAGPGLAAPDELLPFALPQGYGAVVVKNIVPGEQRQQFYEPFGGKSYYTAPTFDQTVSQTGTWYLYVWDPSGMGGDYVAVIGFKERFSLLDILRALINTPKIRLDRELHTDCRNAD